MIRLDIKPQTPPLPFFDVVASLDGVNYTLQFRWNERGMRLLSDGTEEEGSWFITVLDEPGQEVILGDVKLVVDWPLWRVRADRTPPGFLIAFDTSGEGIDPGLDDLGVRVVIDYITADEIEAAEAAA